MTTDDLRAAAERCRPMFPNTFLDAENASVECVEDLARLAEAYLAEHPADDGEPVTPDWLRSVGFDLVQVKAAGGDFLVARHGSLGASFLRGRTVWGIGDGDEYDLPAPQTRGTVRRLCAALGIELKEDGR